PVAGREPMMWSGDPDVIRDIFGGDPESLHASEGNFVVEGVLGSQSLLLLEGEAHRRERKLMMPPFHGERMRAYSQEMRRIAAAAVATDRWAVGSTFSLLPEMQAVTLDIIMRTVFGVDEASETWRLRDLLREFLARASDPLVFGATVAFGPTRVRDWVAARSE